MKVADLFEQDDYENKAAPEHMNGEMLRLKNQMKGTEEQLNILLQRVETLTDKGILTREQNELGGTHMQFHVPKGLMSHEELKLFYHVEPGEIGGKRYDALIKLQVQCQNTWNHYTVLRSRFENLFQRANNES